MPKTKTEIIGGRNPVYEVLRAGRRRVHRLLLAEGLRGRGRLQQALDLATSRGIACETASRAVLDRLAANHQGLAAEVDPYPYVAVEDILERARQAGEPPFVLLLDTLQDPQNFGTLLRTAEAVGVHGVILPGHHSVGVTAAVVGASSGASEHLLVALDNLSQAVQALQAAGVWVAGLENSPAARPLESVELRGPLGLVVGSEAGGMRRLVRERCDVLLRLPMRGQVDSLNAAVAGSIALYAAWAARRYAGARMSEAETAEPASGAPPSAGRSD